MTIYARQGGAAMGWSKKRLLIWGKTYPEFSSKYYETVCTGAVDGDTGKLIRLYPITLRYLKEKFKTYHWIEAEVQRNTSDFRPESFKVKQDTIAILEHLGTKPKEWAERARWVLGPGNVFPSVEALQAAEGVSHTSLGLVRPRVIDEVYKKRKPEKERKEWDEQRARALAQRDLFVDTDSVTKELAFCPVQYRMKFRCADAACSTQHDFGIHDWGTYVLDYDQYTKRGEETAEEKVVEKIRQLMDPAKRDPYLFLGNTKAHPQAFMIVGLFHPPRAAKKEQTSRRRTSLVAPRLPGL